MVDGAIFQCFLRPVVLGLATGVGVEWCISRPRGRIAQFCFCCSRESHLSNFAFFFTPAVRFPAAFILFTLQSGTPDAGAIVAAGPPQKCLRLPAAAPRRATGVASFGRRRSGSRQLEAWSLQTIARGSQDFLLRCISSSLSIEGLRRICR